MRLPVFAVSRDRFSQQHLGRRGILECERLAVQEAAQIIVRRAPGERSERRHDSRKPIFGLIQHAAQKHVRLLNPGIEPDRPQERVDRFGKAPQAVVGDPGRQLELSALVELLAARIHRLERLREILLF